LLSFLAARHAKDSQGSEERRPIVDPLHAGQHLGAVRARLGRDAGGDVPPAALRGDERRGGVDDQGGVVQGHVLGHIGQQEALPLPPATGEGSPLDRARRGQTSR